MAFESKLTKSSKSTDFRISPTLCTMFNVMVDAKDQSAKLCAMEMGQEVKTSPATVKKIIINVLVALIIDNILVVHL